MIKVTSYWGSSRSTSIVDVTKMPGGEMHPTIGADNLNALSYTITADTRNSDDLFAILLVHNALKRNDPGKQISLRIGYTPYARQDRVANRGEALSIEAFADFINMMNFARVEIADPHSDVTPSLIRNAVVVDQTTIVKDHLLQGSGFRRDLCLDPKEWVLVAPDAGAIKKIDKLYALGGFTGAVYMDKERDTKTGRITRTFPRLYIQDGKHTPLDHLAGKKLLVVDDICDGGRTFIEIAAALNEYKPEKLSLYVTHGIFSKGTDCLFKAGYDQLFTTNSFDMASWNADHLTLSEDLTEEEKRVIRFNLIKAN